MEEQVLPITEALALPVESQDVPVIDTTEAEKPQEESKPELTEEQKRIRKLENALSRKRQQLADERAERAYFQRQGLTQQQQEPDNRAQNADSEVLSLTRAQISELAAAEAKRLAPQVAHQEAQEATRRATATSMADKLGHEKFAELTADLADILPGEMQLHLLDMKSPDALLQYLADPENESEARALSRMSPFKAGATMSELAAKLAAPKDKPQASKVPPPVEAGRGQGSINRAPDPSNTKAWVKWANEREAKGLA